MKKTLLLLTLLLVVSCLALPVSAEGAPDAAPTETVESAPTAETVLSFFTENGSTLLSALGVAVSLLLAFLYKSGLLPLVSRGLSAISESSDKAAGMTAEFTSRASDALHALEEKTSAAVSQAEETAAIVQSTHAVLEALQDALREAKEERDRISLVLAEETALFYELLNSVKLPETQKDVIRQRYYKYQTMLEGITPSSSLEGEGDAE